jgi:hypothetical protein
MPSTPPQGEVLQYPTVHFLGRPGTAKIKGDMRMQKTNFGYDDERGDYVTVTNDHIAYRYEVLGILGKGSFGQVLKCLDHKSGGMVGHVTGDGMSDHLGTLNAAPPAMYSAATVLHALLHDARPFHRLTAPTQHINQPALA